MMALDSRFLVSLPYREVVGYLKDIEEYSYSFRPPYHFQRQLHENTLGFLVGLNVLEVRDLKFLGSCSKVVRAVSHETLVSSS